MISNPGAVPQQWRSSVDSVAPNGSDINVTKEGNQTSTDCHEIGVIKCFSLRQQAGDPGAASFSNCP